MRLEPRHRPLPDALVRAETRRKIRCALMLLLGLRGTPILYYGDELGMEQVEIPEDEQLDTAHSRDGARTPMPWAPPPITSGGSATAT